MGTTLIYLYINMDGGVGVLGLIKRRATIMLLTILTIIVMALPANGEPLNKANQDTETSTKKIILIIIDGLNDEALKNTTAPNIKGLASAGLQLDKAVPAYPHDTYSSITSILTGTTGQQEKSSILTLLESQGIKTSIFDGTEKMTPLYKGVSNVVKGPFNGKDSLVIDQVIKELNENGTYFNVVILPQLRQVLEKHGANSNTYKKQITATDNDVGRLLHYLHTEGMFEQTLFIVSGTHNQPPLIFKGPPLKVGITIPPASLMDIAPTVAYLTGTEMKQAEGMVLYNAMKSGGDRGEAYLLSQRVQDLSIAYSQALEGLHRLEQEKTEVRKEQAKVAKEKQTIQQEIEQRDQEIKKLSNKIFLMKVIGIVLLVTFVVGYIVEYLILRKRFLMF